jgi:predicted nucleic acid-binding Zn ribbon protein
VSVRRLSTILETLLADTLGLPAAAAQVRLLRSWGKIVGPLLGGKTSPGKIRNGVLTVFVRNHAWAQELQLSKPALLERIRSFEGGDAIREIRFAVDSGSCPSDGAESLPGKEPSPAAEPSPHPDGPLPPDPGGLEEVRDPETREILRSISRKSSRRKG